MHMCEMASKRTAIEQPASLSKKARKQVTVATFTGGEDWWVVLATPPVSTCVCMPLLAVASSAKGGGLGGRRWCQRWTGGAPSRMRRAVNVLADY